MKVSESLPPQSLSPSQRYLMRTQRPPGPPMPPKDPRHLNSPSGQLGIGSSQLFSSEASEQSISPSHWKLDEMQLPSPHWNSPGRHLYLG